MRERLVKLSTTLINILLTLSCLTSCSSEQLRRTSYETIKAADRQRCLNEGFSDCPRQSEYDDFQQERENALNPESSQETR